MNMEKWMDVRILKKGLFLFFLMSLLGGCVSPADHKEDSLNVVSPNGALRMVFSTSVNEEDGLFWQVYFQQKEVMKPSRLGFELEGMAALSNGFKVIKVERMAYGKTWKPPFGEASSFKDHYNEMSITLQEKQAPLRQLVLHFRAYDEGVAFRTTFPKQAKMKSCKILRENTSFSFVGDHQAWVTERAQGGYKTVRLSKLNPKKEYERPFVMKTDSGLYLAVLEAGLLDYSRSLISREKEVPFGLITTLSGPATISFPYSTPWRVLMVGKTPGELLQHNYLLLNLSPKNRLDDTSWIKPGKQCREYTLTTKNSKAMVDFLAANGLDYLELDTGWYGEERNEKHDATTPTRATYFSRFGSYDFHEILQYAKSKNIGVVLYVNRIHMRKQLDEILPLYKKWGIAGIKIGFVDVGSQEATTWLHETIRKCAKYHLFVDVHDEYRPTGIERTYPNFLTSEGVKGNEGNGPTPKQNVENTFIRCLCGPTDFTMAWHNKRVKLTWAHQMASAVIYYSPLQTIFWSDRADTFTGKEPYLKYFTALPTVWDEKRVIQGEIGEFITIARRKGTDWFVGTMNANKQRQLTIPLSFLAPGEKYTATIYFDTDPADPSQMKSVQIKTIDVTAESVIKADMANNGGQAIWIQKQ